MGSDTRNAGQRLRVLTAKGSDQQPDRGRGQTQRQHRSRDLGARLSHGTIEQSGVDRETDGSSQRPRRDDKRRRYRDQFRRRAELGDDHDRRQDNSDASTQDHGKAPVGGARIEATGRSHADIEGEDEKESDDARKFERFSY